MWSTMNYQFDVGPHIADTYEGKPTQAFTFQALGK